MKSLLTLLLCIFVANSFARSGPPSGGAKRGGQGFLFEDFNSFSNPGQKALFRGFSAQAAYDTTLNTGTKSITPSVIWGKGSFGLGGFVSRSGSDMMSSNNSTDSIGGAFGLGLAANRITLGAGFSRSVDVNQNMDGTLTASLNFNGLGGKGFHIGGAVSTTVNRATRDIKTATAGIGWGFGRVAVEAIYEIEDLQNPAMNYEMSGFLAWEGETFFSGLGMGYEKVSNGSFAAGRIGLKFGKWDLSAFGNKSFASGSNPTVGAALRIKF